MTAAYHAAAARTLAGAPVMLPSIDRFVDGAAVKRVGALTFDVCRAVLDGMTLVPEGRVCTTILSLYNTEAIVVEPAGACDPRRILSARSHSVFACRNAHPSAPPVSQGRCPSPRWRTWPRS